GPPRGRRGAPAPPPGARPPGRQATQHRLRRPRPPRPRPGVTRTRALPRSLDPLPGESLAGYLLRLSFRLGVPPGQVAAITGLTTGTGTIPASRMLILDDAVT